MEIIFCKNESPKNTLKKIIFQLFSITGVLKDSSSIANPTILIDKNSEIINANYCYIPEYKRYYFIEDIESVKNNLWMISLHVDVLMSFSSDILKTSGIVARQEKDYNSKLVDTLHPVSNDVDVYNYTFGAVPFNKGNYVVAIATGFEKRGE